MGILIEEILIVTFLLLGKDFCKIYLVQGDGRWLSEKGNTSKVKKGNTGKVVLSLSKPQLLTRLDLRPDLEVLSRAKLILIQHVVWKTSSHEE